MTKSFDAETKIQKLHDQTHETTLTRLERLRFEQIGLMITHPLDEGFKTDFIS